MFYLWMKILLIFIIIAIGLLVVKKNKGTAEAATASVASFVMLFAIAALYLFLVVALQQADLLFWLVAAAIVFPFLTYVAVFASVKNAHHAIAARTTGAASSKTVRPVVAAPVARKAVRTPHRTAKKAPSDSPERIPSASRQSPVMPASAESTHAAGPSFQPLEFEEYEFAYQEEAIEGSAPMEEAPILESQPEHLQPLAIPQENPAETTRKRKPLRAYQPVHSPRPISSSQTDLKIDRIIEPESLQVEQSAIQASETPIAPPAPKPLRPLFAEASQQLATASVRMKPLQSEQAQPDSMVVAAPETDTAPAEVQEQEPAFDPFADCCSKAQTLRAKGLHATAGALYERAAAMKADGTDSYSALFNALSCYTKADKTAEACAVAQRLSAHVEDLQPGETAKLSAMLAYLQRHLK